MDADRLRVLRDEYGDYDENARLGAVYGTATIGEFLSAINIALAALDAETPATPADVGEKPVAFAYVRDGHLFALSPDKSVQCPDPLYSATALERVVRERDEARANEDDGLAWDALALCRKRAEAAEKAIAGLKQNARVAIDAGEVLIGELTRERNSAEAKLAEARKEADALRARLETVEAETRERCAKVVDALAMRIEDFERQCRAWTGPDPRGLRAEADELKKARMLRNAAAAIRNLEPRHD